VSNDSVFPLRGRPWYGRGLDMLRSAATALVLVAGLTAATYAACPTLDHSLAGDGIAATPVGTGGGLGANALAIQPDGRIVLVGKEYTVTRLDPDGTPDPGFARDGVARTSMPGDAATATAVALQADGRIAVAGVASSFSFRGETRSIAPTRYLNGGSKRDADADGFADRRDRCRYDPSRRHRGCPLVRRRISIKRIQGGFGGRVSLLGPASCARDSKVKLLRKRPGTDRVVARTRVRRGHKYRFRVHRPHGTYYAVAKSKVVFGIGLCGSARSRKLAAGR
jgi:hypothetical protein